MGYHRILNFRIGSQVTKIGRFPPKKNTFWRTNELLSNKHIIIQMEEKNILNPHTPLQQKQFRLDNSRNGLSLPEGFVLCFEILHGLISNKNIGITLKKCPYTSQKGDCGRTKVEMGCHGGAQTSDMTF